MPAEITMPQLSDTMTEGTVVKWHKKEGDKVNAGDELADVETDKATMPYESPEAGVLALVALKEGEKAPVGALMGVVATKGDDVEAIKKNYAGKGQGAARPQSSAVTASKQGAENVPPATPAPRGGAVATMEAASAGEVHEPADVGHGATREAARAVPPLSARGGNGEGNGHGERVKVTPLARRIAEENGIDLSQVQGSGPGGRIVQQDVLNFMENGGKSAPDVRPGLRADAKDSGKPAPTLPPAMVTGEKQIIPMTKMRIAIAAALQRSKQTVPHFYETIDVDMEQVSGLREKLNHRLESEDIRLSLADFVHKAVASALVRHPALNARYNAEKNEITRYADVNLGLAVAIPDGLIVPVLRGANHMGLRELRVRSADLFDRAKAQRLKREEQSEATFTVSGLGQWGVREFSAIINPPEVAILAVGAAEKRAVVRGEQVVGRTTMSLTLSCDHRAVDGATGAEFLRTLKELLEDPGMMLV